MTSNTWAYDLASQLLLFSDFNSLEFVGGLLIDNSISMLHFRLFLLDVCVPLIAKCHWNLTFDHARAPRRLWAVLLDLRRSISEVGWIRPSIVLRLESLDSLLRGLELKRLQLLLSRRFGGSCLIEVYDGLVIPIYHRNESFHRFLHLISFSPGPGWASRCWSRGRTMVIEHFISEIVSFSLFFLCFLLVLLLLPCCFDFFEGWLCSSISWRYITEDRFSFFLGTLYHLSF